MVSKVIINDLKYITEYDLPWHRFEGKTVLVSGANGFLPAYMVETLLFLVETHKIESIKIVALVRNEQRAQKRFVRYIDNDKLKLLVQDVCDPIAFSVNPDYIIHAASQASPKYYGIDPVGTLNANIIGTYNLLQLAKSKSIEGFLYFSSGEVYGEIDDNKIPTREGDFGYIDPMNVRSCYAESKRMGETMCASWHHQFSTPVKIVRPFHTYGPGMKLDDGRVFADFVADIISCRDIIMKSNGKAKRAFCYLADATIAFFTVLLKGSIGEAYNVGNSDAEISILDLAETLVGIYPDLRLKVIKKDDPDDPGYIKSKITRNCPDISKIRSLGWEPKIQIIEGFKNTIDSFL